jgi:hypothetical protein
VRVQAIFFRIFEEKKFFNSFFFQKMQQFYCTQVLAGTYQWHENRMSRCRVLKFDASAQRRIDEVAQYLLLPLATNIFSIAHFPGAVT